MELESSVFHQITYVFAIHISTQLNFYDNLSNEPFEDQQILRCSTLVAPLSFFLSTQLSRLITIKQYQHSSFCKAKVNLKIMSKKCRVCFSEGFSGYSKLSEQFNGYLSIAELMRFSINVEVTQKKTGEFYAIFFLIFLFPAG
jgi:hypothetical protein